MDDTSYPAMCFYEMCSICRRKWSFSTMDSFPDYMQIKGVYYSLVPNGDPVSVKWLLSIMKMTSSASSGGNNEVDDLGWVLDNGIKGALVFNFTMRIVFPISRLPVDLQ